MKWAGKSGGVVIVKDNDIFYRSDPNNAAQETKIIAVKGTVQEILKCFSVDS